MTEPDQEPRQDGSFGSFILLLVLAFVFGVLVGAAL